MKKSRIVLTSSVIISIFIISSVPFLAYSLDIAGSSESNSEEDVPVSSGFYDEIGQSYDAITGDGLKITVFRYHAPGKEFNDGAQPVLLFPGLACCINVYLSHTTPLLAEKFDITLPADLEDWAVGDENIQNDPLLYYSVAYYLWKKGYDPWFGNYRGMGYGEVKSEMGSDDTSIDDFAVYDVRAAVRKVNEITGLHPVIGGHSTGGLVSVMYLHGTDYTWTGHLRSQDSLVDERNGITIGPETVEGFIGLDCAMIPVLPDLLDSTLMWTLLAIDYTLDCAGLINTFTNINFIDTLFQGLLSLMVDEDLLGDTIVDFLKNTGNLYVSNVNDVILYYFLKYGVSVMYSRTLGQYLDFYVQQECREFWKNGINLPAIEPPAPKSYDSYYYYTGSNMEKISVPFLCYLAEAENDVIDLVDAQQIIADVLYGKTANENDELHWLPAAHIDVPVGISNPSEMFPYMSDWLAKI